MNIVRTSVITAMLLGTALVASPGGASAAGAGDAAAHYRTIDLGTLGGAQSTARAMNERGQIVGSSDTADGATHPFLWQNGVMTDLGILGGYTGGASAINEHGQVVGTCDTGSGYQHAFLWQHGRMTDLGTLGGEISAANGINDRGEVTGVSVTANDGWHAFLWRDGTMRDIGRFDANAINNRGQVAGTSSDHSAEAPRLRYAVRWQGGTLTRLPAGASRGEAINDHGDVIGTLDAGEDLLHSFLWHDGTLTDLGTLGGKYGAAYAINGRGQIVGQSSTTTLGDDRPVLWYRGTVTDLTTRGLAPDAFVVAIDDRGRLAGSVGGRAALFR